LAGCPLAELTAQGRAGPHPLELIAEGGSSRLSLDFCSTAFKTAAMHFREIIAWLRETDEARLAELWRRADRVRQQHVGGEVHLRGLVELSNHCVRLCAYCGLRAENARVKRYRMSQHEVLACAHQAAEYGYGTVVLQSGEDPGLTRDGMADLIRRVKRETPLAVTLSLGERADDELAAWREAGADRYLLRFETSNRELYDRVHPPKPGPRRDRLAILDTLRELGYEVGSGVMIGIPGQTYDDLAADVERFAALDLDMIGVGPYLVHPETPLGRSNGRPVVAPEDQVPADELTTYKVISLSRLICPRANIPATTALATLNATSGRAIGLERGANVIMPDLTPPQYRVHYEIYPGKACLAETAEECHVGVLGRIAALGRRVGAGRGDSLNYAQRGKDSV
jgi:biotin synthase